MFQNIAKIFTHPRILLCQIFNNSYSDIFFRLTSLNQLEFLFSFFPCLSSYLPPWMCTMPFNSTEVNVVLGFINASSLIQAAPLNNTIFNLTTTNETQSCHVWQDVQHILFQLGSLCMAFSFLTPISFQYHVLFLRCLLLFTFLFYILWAGLFICLPDILAWNCAFFFINIAQILYLAYNMYPVHINKEFEDAYAKLFKPLGVSRIEFRSLTRIGSLVYLRQGSVYATEGITPCGEKLSLLLRGRWVNIHFLFFKTSFFLPFMICSQSHVEILKWNKISLS